METSTKKDFNRKITFKDPESLATYNGYILREDNTNNTNNGK
jgi:hypothetical protein